MAAAASLDVERMDRPAVEDGQGVLDRQALVEPVGVQGDRDVVLLGHGQGHVEGAQVGAGVLVDLEPAHAGLEGLEQRARLGRRPATQDAHVDGPRVEGGVGLAQRPT